MFTQRLDIGDQRLGGVGREVMGRIDGERAAASAPALLERDDQELVGIEPAAAS
jgi:hypothetical protein